MAYMPAQQNWSGGGAVQRHSSGELRLRFPPNVACLRIVGLSPIALLLLAGKMRVLPLVLLLMFCKVTGTAFPICLILSVHEPWNTKLSGKVCKRALSRIEKYLTEPSGKSSVFSPPGTP